MEVVLISEQGKDADSIIDLLFTMQEIKNTSTFKEFSAAQEYLRSHLADLVLLDAEVQETNWLIQYRKIKAINRATKVVLVSRNEDAAVKAYEEGVWDYLLKPVKKGQLARVVKKLQNETLCHNRK